jgi:hypothetical protein
MQSLSISGSNSKLKMMFYNFILLETIMNGSHIASIIIEAIWLLQGVLLFGEKIGGQRQIYKPTFTWPVTVRGYEPDNRRPASCC